MPLTADDHRRFMIATLADACAEAGFWLDAYFLEPAAGTMPKNFALWLEGAYQLAAHTTLQEILDGAAADLLDTLRTSDIAGLPAAAGVVQALDGIFSERASRDTSRSHLLAIFTRRCHALAATGCIGRYSEPDPAGGNAGNQA